MKKYTADERTRLDRRLPGISKQREVKIAEPEPTDQSNSDGFEPAIRIEGEKKSGDKKNYTLLFLKTDQESGVAMFQTDCYRSTEYVNPGIG